MCLIFGFIAGACFDAPGWAAFWILCHWLSSESE